MRQGKGTHSSCTSCILHWPKQIPWLDHLLQHGKQNPTMNLEGGQTRPQGRYGSLETQGCFWKPLQHRWKVIRFKKRMSMGRGIKKLKGRRHKVITGDNWQERELALQQDWAGFSEMSSRRKTQRAKWDCTSHHGSSEVTCKISCVSYRVWGVVSLITKRSWPKGY